MDRSFFHQREIDLGVGVTLDNGLLEDVRDVWTNGSSYSTRVAALTNSLLTPNGTVLDDSQKDDLRGNSSRDLFFADLAGTDKDKVKDKSASEELFEWD